MKKVVVVAILAVLVGGLAWRARWIGSRPPERPEIVVYLIDTLRADRLGCYGYPRARTPAMDRLARRATLFSRAYSPSSWTRPAVGSLLTGLEPAEHGAVGRENRLRDVTTLAELLGSDGYTTAAFVSNPNVLPVFGFDRGFDTFVDVESIRRSGTADRVHREVLRYLDGGPETPRFLYVHTRDPHAPYEPPRPWNLVFQTGGGQKEYVNALYDGEIAFADRELGRFLRDLRARGLGDEALIVVLSDHGEEFLDHGGIMHGKTLYEEQIRVPLIVRMPGRHPGAIDSRTARIADLVPGLCSLLRLDRPPGVGDGSFLEPASPPRESPAERVFAELEVDGGRLNALVRGRHKLIERTLPRDAAGRRLYDLEADPGELTNLAASEPERVDGMVAFLEEVLAERQEGVRLEIINGAEGGETHAVSGSLVLEHGVFDRVQPADLESGDQVHLSEDRTRIDLEVMLSNWIDPVARPPVLRVDRDWIRVVPSEEGKLEVKVFADGHPLPVEEVAEEPTDGGTGAPGGPRCRLHRTGAPAGERVTIDEDLEERLRGLGYVE